MAPWSVEDIPDLSGKTAVVTGGNAGLGFETCYQLARHGARVYLAARDEERGRGAVAAIKCRLEGDKPETTEDGTSEEERVVYLPLDLADLDSVKAFAEAVSKRTKSLDFLINNAGIMMLPQQKTKQGFEMQFGVNHLGHYVLTGHLLPLLKAAPAARVINVSSLAHLSGSIDWDDLPMEKSYGRVQAYARSKLANVLFTRGLAKRLEESKIICASATPGYAATGLQRKVGGTLGIIFDQLVNRLFAQSAANGALPQLRAAVDPETENNDYYAPSFLQMWIGASKASPSNAAQSDELAERLWQESEALTGIKYKF